MFFLRLFLMGIGFAVASLHGIVIALLREDRSLVARDYARSIERFMQPPLGLRVETLGVENLRTSRPCVFITNHQSAYDVPVLAGIFPERTVLIAKQELRRIPLFGWLYEATGNILIDRANSPGAIRRLREAEEAIRERGVSVWIFPEGTRGTVPGKLLPFRKGAFHLAIAAEVPIVPVVVSPIRNLFDFERRFIQPGMVQVRILEPISTAGYTEEGVPELLERAQRRMQVALDELRTIPAGGGWLAAPKPLARN